MSAIGRFNCIAISLWSFLSSAIVWFMLSVSLSVFPQSLCRSASMTTVPLRSSIFWTKTDFFNEFNTDSGKFKIFVLLSPNLNNLLKCPRREMKILKFSRWFSQYASLPYGCSAVQWCMFGSHYFTTEIPYS